MNPSTDPKPSIPTAELARLYFTEKLSLQKIAATVDLDPSGIKLRLNRAGYTLRPANDSRRLVSTADLARLYFDEQLSSVEISKRVGMASPSAITRRLQRAGYKLRANHESHVIKNSRVLSPDRRVVCKLCGRSVSRLSGIGNGHLWLVHEMTTWEYRRQFPGAPLRSAAAKEYSLSALQGLRAPALAKLAEAQLVLSQRTPEEMIKTSRLTVAAGLELRGVTRYKISFTLFPEQHVKNVAVNNTTQFFKRNSRDLEKETLRLRGLPDDTREATIEAAVSHLARQTQTQQNEG